jgi:lipoprotein signal peptidase
MTRNALTALGAGAAVIVLAADQVSKWWVRDVLDLPTVGSIALLPVLNLTWVENPGVTFGLLTSLGAWGTPVLAVGALIVVVALGVWLRRTDRALVAGAIGAIGGGAVGNVIDRLRFGRVEDFIHAHAFGYSWYVFNVADAAIVCGVAALLLDGLRAPPAGRNLADAGDRV